MLVPGHIDACYRETRLGNLLGLCLVEFPAAVPLDITTVCAAVMNEYGIITTLAYSPVYGSTLCFGFRQFASASGYFLR